MFMKCLNKRDTISKFVYQLGPFQPSSLATKEVHCLTTFINFFRFSAGVGRTGVFITLSIVLERMQYEGVVDVFQTVRALRTQRPAMVQTEDQYQFCYRAALEYLSSFDQLYPDWQTSVLEFGVWNRLVILRLATKPMPPYVSFRLHVSWLLAVWPDGGIKISPSFSKSCPKSSLASLS